ncbi:hypothetical protein FDF15_06040 [Clostridium botulinum]|uniref:AAA family ATPase n=1 Tax=Clostridium botulinum TaxID=1491 RepID=UPI000773C5F5|nr:AAA family ATPase [Clostridium botulinum]APH22699.1 AAA domain protein [Clostridium botulinum]APQ69830.1 AAA domain protein [Clostridium botulinum]MBN3377403.1 hypothetical protein [Clostridium botulinum]MBN3404503.1 hypothetical protein [Clostridium botulinum]MBY6996881.1 AAA family ATPase [Clostridium botulinum]
MIENITKLKEVYIKNFRGYGLNLNRQDNYYVFPDLDKDFVLLNGFNGYGKTSFFEAIEWCLTDSVERLTKFKDVYGSKKLKKSYYLKFCSIGESKAKINKREIDVKLVFNNGVILRRTTKSNFLKVTDKDRYISYSEATLNEERLEGDWNEIISKHIFQRESKYSDKVGFINTNFLGQENMNSFVRSKKPTDRKDTLMQLLNLEDIQKIITKAEKINSSKAISNKISENNSVIERNSSYRSKIDERFNNNNWGSINNYIELLNIELNSLKEICLRNKFSDTLEFNINEFSTLFSVENCINKLKTFKLIKENTQKTTYKLDAQVKQLNKLSEDVVKIRYIDDYIKQYNSYIQANFLIENDYIKINDSIEKVSNDNKKQIISLNKYEDNKKFLNDNYYIWKDKINIILDRKFSKLINISDSRISEDFWQSYCTHLKSILQTLRRYKHFFKGETIQVKEVEEAIAKGLNKNSQFKRYKELDDKTINLLEIIKTQEKLLGKIESSNNTYNDLLRNVKDYIIKNRSDLNECPVCHNKDFTKERYKELFPEFNDKKENIDSLLNVIDLTMASGDKIYESVTSEITKLKIERSSIKELIKKEVIDELKSEICLIYNKFINILKVIINEIDTRIADVNKCIENNKKNLQDLVVCKTRYEDCYKIIFDNKISDKNYESIKEVIKDKIHEIKQNKQEMLNKIVIGLNYPYKPTIDEVKVKKGELISLIDNKEKCYIEDYQKLLDNITILRDKLNFYKIINDNISKVLSYDLPEEYEHIFKEIKKNEERLNVITYENKVLESYLKNSSNILENAKKIEKSIFENLSKNNTVISWIYKQINPHPYYRDLSVCLDDSEGVIFKSKSNDIVYGQIFSSAQLNILALSIFLGLGIPQDYTKLGQLFLDDPIQSMDDANVLALIDVFRGIIDSGFNRSLVISTHDDNFSDLISIKMRNKDITHFNFIGYGEEGPYIEKVR